MTAMGRRRSLPAGRAAANNGRSSQRPAPGDQRPAPHRGQARARRRVAPAEQRPDRDLWSACASSWERTPRRLRTASDSSVGDHPLTPGPIEHSSPVLGLHRRSHRGQSHQVPPAGCGPLAAVRRQRSGPRTSLGAPRRGHRRRTHRSTDRAVTQPHPPPGQHTPPTDHAGFARARPPASRRFSLVLLRVLHAAGCPLQAHAAACRPWPDGAGAVGLSGTGLAAVATTLAPSTSQAALPRGERPAQRGGAEGTRTPDPHTASVVRYQLRHSPLVPARSGVSEPSTTIQSGWRPLGRGSPPRRACRRRARRRPRRAPRRPRAAGRGRRAEAQADGGGVICATRIEFPNGSRKPKSMP
jgi:hypothetical protein